MCRNLKYEHFLHLNPLAPIQSSAKGDLVRWGTFGPKNDPFNDESQKE